ncbi:MAG TPA: dihydropteroate synthase, partial [Nitratifractor sp.]|nr:dihydropteroate synthase [Nitratifractor sp.]
MRIYEIAKPFKSREYLKQIGVDGGGVAIIAKKMDIFYIQIEQ